MLEQTYVWNMEGGSTTTKNASIYIFDRQSSFINAKPSCLAFLRLGDALYCSLISNHSQGKPGNCPTCRVPMGQGRSLLALTVVKNAQHECGHQGCHVKLKIHQIKDHEEKCIWRLILCPGKGTFCTARVPLSTLLNHVQTCIDCKWPPKQVNREGTLIENKIGMDRVGGLNANWPTTVLQLEGGFFFFVRCAKKDGNYVVDVVMKGSQEDCEDFMVEASLLNVESGKSVMKASFQPRPLTNQNEAIYREGGL